MGFYKQALALLLLQAGHSSAITQQQFDCALPTDADKYSVITIEDATIGAHNMYKGLAIGGELRDGTPNESGVVDRYMSYVGQMDDASTNFNFNGGLTKGATVDHEMMAHFEYLATSATDCNINGKKVVVVTSGGTYNMYDFNNGGQGEDNGNTVVIFNTAEDIIITKTPDGRQFGPSIIAPFAKVSVKGDAGYVDGFVMAKSFETTGGNQGALQLHGDTYKGAFQCGATSTVPAPVPPPADSTTPPASTPVPQPPQDTCVAQWGACTGAMDSCCDGLVCEGDQWYAQCKEGPPADPLPSSGTCVAEWGACTGAMDSCCDGLICEGNQWYAQCKKDPAQLAPVDTCVAKWGACTGAMDSCCDGLACIGDQWYAQCKDPPATDAPVASPTSEAPVSQAPVSQAPVSQAPVSQAPVSKAPVSSAPVSQAPVSKAPVSQAPVSSAPVSQAPVSKAPVSQAPVSKAPVSQAPVSGAPVSQAPVSKAPVSQAPVSKAPVSQAPVSKAPVSQAPVSKAPVSQAPVSKAPVSQAPSKAPKPATPQPTEEGDPRRGTKGTLPPTSAPPPLDVLPKDVPKTQGGGGGDPHFKTWTGKKFDYHGECDLVLVNSPAFANGLGLRVHIRTTRVGYYSYIERIAVNIGSDVLEFDNHLDNYLLNGKKAGDKPTLAGYEIRKFNRAKAISVRLNDKTKSKIDLFRRRNGMPYVVVDGGHDKDLFQGGLGLIGDWENGSMIARDGKTEVTDATEFALEWQVRDTEPMLFQTIRAPQFPQVCTPPKKRMGNRLGDSHMKKKAEQVCAAWKDDMDDCIFDVMATRDLGGAQEHPVHHTATH